MFGQPEWFSMVSVWVIAAGHDPSWHRPYSIYARVNTGHPMSLPDDCSLHGHVFLVLNVINLLFFFVLNKWVSNDPSCGLSLL